jgi:hypothetical protein
VNGGWLPPDHPIALNVTVTLTTTLSVAPTVPVSLALYDAGGNFLAPLIDRGTAALFVDGEWYAAEIGTYGYRVNTHTYQGGGDLLEYLDPVCSDGPYRLIGTGESIWEDSGNIPPSGLPNVLFLPLYVYPNSNVGYAPVREPYFGFGPADRSPNAAPNMSFRIGPDEPCVSYVFKDWYTKWFRRLKAISLPSLRLPLEVRTSRIR